MSKLIILSLLLHITVIVVVAKMSDSDELSDVPLSDYEEPTLPTPICAVPLGISRPQVVKLPVTTSSLFKQNLYTRTLLETVPPTIRIICQQPNCGYSPLPQPFSVNSTSNLWKHYNQKHPSVSFALKTSDKSGNLSSSPAPSSSFFEPRRTLAKQQVNGSKYRQLVLSFIVLNNLSLNLVKNSSFRHLI